MPDDAAEAVLERFTDVGLIDDSAFAAAWVESRHAGRGLAARALRHELSTRGVAPDVVCEAVQSIDVDAETAAARALVERRMARLSGLPRDVQVRRLAGLLARKGYSGGLSAQVIGEALRAAADEGGAAAPGKGLSAESADAPAADSGWELHFHHE